MLHAGMTPAELCGALAEGQDPAAMDAAVARIQDLQAFLKAFRVWTCGCRQGRACRWSPPGSRMTARTTRAWPHRQRCHGARGFACHAPTSSAGGLHCNRYPGLLPMGSLARQHITNQNRHLQVQLTDKARQPQQQHHITRPVSHTSQPHATVPLYDPPYDRH